MLTALLLPTVKVGVPPATLVTEPVPQRPFSVALRPFKSSVPLTVTLPAAASVGRAAGAANCNVAALLTVVAPA